MKIITPIILFTALLCFTTCNSDEPKYSSAQIQQTISDMRGTYRGSMNVSYYRGEDISKSEEGIAVSDDSLTIYMNLTPLATTIEDHSIAARLLEIGCVKVKAGYELVQIDNGTNVFILHPDDVLIHEEYGAPASVKIVFSQNFGGDSELYYKGIIFNLSPTELWIDNKPYKPFKQLVYHFRGNISEPAEARP